MALINLAVEVTGSIWKIQTEVGKKVAKDDVLLILESMKMEIPLLAPNDGIVREIRIKEGDPVDEGNVVIVMDV